MKSRILVVLDTGSLDICGDKAVELDRALRGITSRWAEGDSETLVVKRAYGWHKTEALMVALGVRAGWRQGGTGELEDVVPYLWNDCKSFCLEQPLSTTLVLCSDRAELAGLVKELETSGVEVCVVNPGDLVGNELVDQVELDKVATLPKFR